MYIYIHTYENMYTYVLYMYIYLYATIIMYIESYYIKAALCVGGPEDVHNCLIWAKLLLLLKTVALSM